MAMLIEFKEHLRKLYLSFSIASNCICKISSIGNASMNLDFLLETKKMYLMLMKIIHSAEFIHQYEH